MLTNLLVLHVNCSSLVCCPQSLTLMRGLMFLYLGVTPEWGLMLNCIQYVQFIARMGRALVPSYCCLVLYLGLAY